MQELIAEARQILRAIAPEYRVADHLTLERCVRTTELTNEQLQAVVKAKRLISQAQGSQ